MVFPVVGGDGKPTGYDIDNSLRFNTADDAFMQRTFTAGTRTKFTISCWVKRGNLSGKPNDDPHRIIDAFKDANNVSNFFFETDDTLRFFHKSAGTTYANVVTNRLFRDPSAWYHLVCAVDTTQSTESNRIKFYVNGVQETSFSTYSVLENLATFFNDNTRICTVGAKDSSSGEKDHFDGYMADFYYVDNQQYDQTYFGETNDNGVWIPVEKGKGAGGNLTFGTNGFFLEFQQTGTSANSSGMGADTSGNDLHLTPNNLAAVDVTTDTPTNNFCTLNPLSAGSDMRANGSFKEGNCELVNGDTGGEANGQKCQGTMGFANGKWYWEVKLISNTMTAGIVDSSIQTSSDINLGSKNAVTYDSETGAINNINGAVQGETVSSQYDDGDIIGVAVDADNGAVYFSKNNTYQNSGNPTSGASKTGGATFTLGNQMLPLAADNSSASAGNHQYNFGNAPFSISSGNTDGKYGNFEYAPPSGYYALCTKRLAEYG
tara:strand:- start:28 stop:1494 length:1467 start_codon:yes stop_codon:yes gene_type:complete